jgi:predicted ester cyclase
MSEAKTIVDRVWQCIEGKRTGELGQLVDADCHFKMPGAEFRSLAGLKELLGAYLLAFPDLRHAVRSTIESADGVALELEVTGTHTGPMHTPHGTIPATGKRVVWESCDVVRIRDGKVTSWHVYHDNLPFMTALGLVKPAQ